MNNQRRNLNYLKFLKKYKDTKLRLNLWVFRIDDWYVFELYFLKIGCVLKLKKWVGHNNSKNIIEKTKFRNENTSKITKNSSENDNNENAELFK